MPRQTTKPTINIKLEDADAEGSYSALVTLYGMEFSVHYVAGEIRVYGTAGQNGKRAWQVHGAAKAVREEIAGRIAALGPQFQDAHAALYQEAA